MNKHLLLSAVVAAALLVPGQALAKRGMQTIGGKPIGLDYSSAIKSRTIGQRCAATICGQAPTVESKKATRLQRNTNLFKSRSRFGTRCAATICRVN